jgi:hypothetical protein
VPSRSVRVPWTYVPAYFPDRQRRRKKQLKHRRADGHHVGRIRLRRREAARNLSQGLADDIKLVVGVTE